MVWWEVQAQMMREERGEGFKRWVFLTIGSRAKGRRMKKRDLTVGDC